MDLLVSVMILIIGMVVYAFRPTEKIVIKKLPQEKRTRKISKRKR